jgi:hypothetical protein
MTLRLPSLRLLAALALPALGAACHRGTTSADGAAPVRSTEREVVFSGSFTDGSNGPAYVWLDSGVIYRLEGGGPVTIRPRMAGAAPIRFAATMVPGGQGAPFQAPASGEYRIDSSYHGRGVISVCMGASRDSARTRQ